MGRKKRPFYRLVAIDSRKRRDGLEIERLGWYNPVQDNLSCNMKEDRILYWLREGAQPSDTVSGLFKRTGLSYKWDLLKRGVKEDKIEELLSEWSERQKAKQELKAEKKKSKKATIAQDNAEISDETEDTPAEEVSSEAEASPEAEAVPVEEEAPAEEVSPEAEAAPEAEVAPAEDETSETEEKLDKKVDDNNSADDK